MAGKTIADIALRKGATIARRKLEQQLTRSGYTKKQIKKVVAGKSYGKQFAVAAITRLATRSIPGALLVGGGFLAKALLDRRKNLRKETASADDISE